MFTRKPTLSFCSILAVLTIFNAAVAAEHKSKCEQRSSTSLDAGESGFEQIVGQYNAMVSAAKAGLKRRPNEVGTWTVSASEIHYLELSGISKSCASSGRKKLCKGAECDFFIPDVDAFIAGDLVQGKTCDHTTSVQTVMTFEKLADGNWSVLSREQERRDCSAVN